MTRFILKWASVVHDTTDTKGWFPRRILSLVLLKRTCVSVRETGLNCCKLLTFNEKPCLVFNTRLTLGLQRGLRNLRMRRTLCRPRVRSTRARCRNYNRNCRSWRRCTRRMSSNYTGTVREPHQRWPKCTASSRNIQIKYNFIGHIHVTGRCYCGCSAILVLLALTVQ